MLNQSTILTTKKDDWGEGFGFNDYVVRVVDGITYLYFLCPGCGKLIGVSSNIWEKVDIKSLTVRASILHPTPDGCGWHGFMTDGKLERC